MPDKAWFEGLDLSKLNFGAFIFCKNESNEQLKVVLEKGNPDKFMLCGKDLSSDPFLLEGISFASVGILLLEQCTLSAAKLTKILDAAPKLRYLNLDGCSGLVMTPELQQRIDKINQRSAGFGKYFNRRKENPEEVLAEHNPREFLHYLPPDTQFEFKGTNTSRNQGMIIEKLSQYLTLTQKHLDAIPKIQGGICVALSKLFQELSIFDWDAVVGNIQRWNGKLDTLSSELARDFDTLYEKYVKPVYITPERTSRYFNGDDLQALLRRQEACVLYNPWHAICIKPHGPGMWEVYDPNHAEGHQKVSRDKLSEMVQTMIGSLIQVDRKPTQPPVIKDPMAFLEHGGLLTLVHATDQSELLSQLTCIDDYSREALDGILLRDVNGVPAWVKALQTPMLSNFTSKILKQFLEKNPNDGMLQLQRSIAHLAPQTKQNVITQVLQTMSSSPIGQEVSESIVKMLRPSLMPYYEHLLKTPIPKSKTLLSFCESCVAIGSKNQRLIQTASQDESNSMMSALLKHAEHIKRPVFYVNGPEDLVCASPFVKATKHGKGELTNGPGGPLFDFLQKHKGQAPLLVINYDAFKTADLIRFNSLLDRERRVDGTDLPEDVLVIGLMNTEKPDCYQGSDFYSRFDAIDTYTWPITTSKADTILDAKGKKAPHVINLFHSPDWKERLMGRWVLNDGELSFQEGELTKALQKGGEIIIQNGLWEDEAFKSFWHHAYVSKLIPENRCIMKSEGYDWDALSNTCSFEKGFQEGAIVLNPGRLGEFFETYVCKEPRLIRSPGMLEKYHHQPLHVNLTRALNHDEWAMLLTACQTHQVQLITHMDYPLELPSQLKALQPPKPNVPAWSRDLQPLRTELIVSTDQDVTLLQCIGDEKDWEIIDISECRTGDLLRRLDGKLVPGEPPHFSFNEQPSYLLNALQAGKKIILKGHFSDELLDDLAPLLLRSKDSKGTLVLITEQQDISLNHHQHQVTVAEKRALLGEVSNALESELEKLSLSELKAKQSYPAGSPWVGLKELLPAPKRLLPFNEETSAIDAELYIHERRKEVKALLQKAPFVYLTGLTGVGKSTFVEENLCEPGDVLFKGETEILRWASTTPTSNPLYLFIDEANLSDRQWSEFEGLFNDPPTIFIQGRLIQLSPLHKVIFAGNPVQYGDERHLAPLFERHGNAILFSPLPASVLHEKVIKPIFDNTPSLAKDVSDISAHLLKLADFFYTKSTEKMLITSREIEMVALLVRSQHLKNPNLNPLELTEYYAHQIMSPIVPKAHRAAFESSFKPKEAITFPELPTTSNFFFTPSRHLIRQQILDRLMLREQRRQEPDLNKVQQMGGLGGLLIEGEPGIGKSELVVSALIDAGYKEQRSLTEKNTTDKVFYKMPASMGLQEKEALLFKAFDEGAVVLMDEINSSPMMERLLNDLLTGKRSPRAPKKPDDFKPEPGFMVIGTQNPITMAGRRAMSGALARRMTLVTLEPYTSAEMQMILVAKGVPEEEAPSIILAFERQVALAKKNHSSDVLNFRTLIKLVDHLAKDGFQPLSQIKTCLELLSELQLSIEQTCVKESPVAKWMIENHLSVESLTKAKDLGPIVEELKQKKHELLEEKKGYLLSEFNNIIPQGLDEASRIFCNQYPLHIQNIKTLDEIDDKLKAFEQDGLNLLKSYKVTEVLLRRITDFRTRALEITSVGMGKKADSLEKALATIPFDKRHEIHLGKTPEAKALLEVLATHRHFSFFRPVKDEENKIIRKSAARSYGFFLDEVSSIEKNTHLPQSSTLQEKKNH